MEESKKVNNFVNLVGICSPGLSSAPAIAEWVESVAEQKGFAKNTIEKTVKLHHNRLKELPEDKINELVKADSRYGRIICRCEKSPRAKSSKLYTLPSRLPPSTPSSAA